MYVESVNESFILLVSISLILDIVKTDFDYGILEVELKKCDSNTPTSFNVNEWKTRLSIARGYKAFNTTEKRSDLEVPHTMFSAPFVVDSVASSLIDGMAPNSDWQKRKPEINAKSLTSDDAAIDILDLNLWQTMNDLQTSRKEAIFEFAASIGIKWSSPAKLTRRFMIASIRKYITEKKGIVDEEFTKFYPTFRGTTGGIMVVLCTHGVVYYAKSLIGGEGPSDAADAMLAVRAKIFIYDAVGSVVNYMAFREPNFFGVNRGLPVRPHRTNLKLMQEYLNSSKARLASKTPALISLQELKNSPFHTALVDPLHIENSQVEEDRYFRRVEWVADWPLDQNHMVHEQIWSRTLKMVTSISQMSYANFVATFTRNILFHNKQVAQRLCEKYRIREHTDRTN